MPDPFLRPRAGLTVRDPVTRRALSPTGERKPLTPYWRRRLADGDVVVTPEPKPAPAPQPVPAPAAPKDS